MTKSTNFLISKESLLKFDSIGSWLEFKGENTKKVYLIILFNFYKWLQISGSDVSRGLNPDELVAFQARLNQEGRDRRLILKDILRYIDQEGDFWRTRYKRKILSTVSSFFSYSLEDMGGFPGLRNGEARKVLKGLRQVEKELTFDQLKKIIDRSNQLYGTVFRCMLSSGMGIGEVVQWSNQGIDELLVILEEPYNGTNGDIIEIELRARKRNLDGDYHTHIGGSALKELKKWLVQREKIKERFYDIKKQRKRERQRVKNEEGINKQTHPETFPEAIFVNNSFKPLSVKGTQSYWMDQVKRHRIVVRGKGKGFGIRYGVNLHQVRKIFRSRWTKSGANPDVAEYLMGHVVDSLDYNRAPHERDFRITEYSKAQPFLDIENPDYGMKDEILEQQKKDLTEIKKEREIQSKIIENLASQLIETKRRLFMLEERPHLQHLKSLLNLKSQYEHALTQGVSAEYFILPVKSGFGFSSRQVSEEDLEQIMNEIEAEKIKLEKLRKENMSIPY